MVFWQGAILELLHSSGRTRRIFIQITVDSFCWGPPDSKQMLFYPLHDVVAVKRGIAKNVGFEYVGEDKEIRAFHIVLRDKRGKTKAATFLAMSTRARNGIVAGFNAVIEFRDFKE